MVSRIILLLLLGAASARAGIDFTTLAHEANFEGVRVAQTAFRDGQELVIYAPPGGWSLQGTPARLLLTPTNAGQADGVIDARPLTSPVAPLDADTIAKLREEIAATLPREAEKLEWEEIEINPLLLNRHETRRLTLSYFAFAQRYKISVVVCNFAEQQVRFRFSARAVDFEKLYEQFRQSLFTWQGMK